MKINKLLTAVFASALLVTTGCRKDDEVVVTPKGAYENGYFISNEGNYGKPNAEVSFASKDLTTIENKVFGSNNAGAQLGDVLQSIGFSGDNAYLVVNNSNKVEIVNRYTFKKVATVTENIAQPRYIAFAANQYYVTNASGKFVSVYNISNNTFIKKIQLENVVEHVVEVGGKIFVQNATYGTGDKLTIINPATNAVETSVKVPEGNIRKTVSAGGFAYVLTATTADSFIYKITPSGAVAGTTKLAGIKKASNLEVSGNQYFFSSGAAIYGMDMSASTVPSPIITQTAAGWDALYGFNVLDGKIFTSHAKGFTEDSEVSVYNTAGTLLKTFKAGMGANGFYKN